MDFASAHVIRLALAIRQSTPHADYVLSVLENSREFIATTRIKNLKSFRTLSAAQGFDLLVADLNFTGIRRMINDMSVTTPIVLLVDPESEDTALDLLQRSRVADYMLTDPAQLRRLPFVLRGTVKRNEVQMRPEKRDQTQVLQDAVYQIAEAADKAASLDALLPQIHHIIAQVMPAENFYIALHDSILDTLNFLYYVDERDPLTETIVKVGKGLTEHVLHSGKSLLCAEESQARLALLGEVQTVGTPSAIWLGVPLIVDGLTMGVMVVQHYQDRDAYGETEQRMLEFVSSQVAMVIHRKRMYDALRASEESFRGVFENATVGLARTTPNGQILLANPALVRMLGFENFEALKKRNLMAEGFAVGYRRQDFLDRMERYGEVRGLESAWLKADGSAIYVRESARAIHDKTGKNLYFESVVEDITDHKRAEAAVQEKIAALQSLAEIDREILAADDAQAILDLVCQRIATLIKAPKSAIVAVEDSSHHYVMATHGLSNTETMEDEFAKAIQKGMLVHWNSHALDDRTGDAAYMPFLAQRENIHALIIEPFLTSSNARGALVVFDTVIRQWTEDEIQLVRLLAGQAALALEKIRLLTDARRRASEFSGLYQVAGEIMSRRDLSSVLRMIVQKAAGFYQVSNAFIYLYDEGRKEVVLSVVSKADLMLGTVLKMGEGLAGRVASSLKPMIVKNYSEWDKRARVYDDRNVLSVLEVPMLFGGNLIGILGIESIDPSRKFDENDLRSLALLAEQAASAINNARLFSQIEDRNRELDRLSRASSTLLAGVSSDIPSLCRSIADLLTSEFHHSHCSIWLVQEDDLTLERSGVAGPFVEIIKPGLLTTKGPGIIAKAIRSQTYINIGDVLVYPEYVSGWEKTRSELVVPLRAGERVLGAIDLQNQLPNAYSADDVRLIEMIASRAALMLEHVRLYQQTDHRLRQLTVLSNIDSAIASSLDLRVTLNILVSQISMHLNADAVDVMLLNPHLQMLEYAAGRGFRRNTIRRVSLLLGEDQAGIAALERTVVSIFDLSSSQVHLQHPERIAGEDFISMYAVPLVAKGQVKGVLELFYRHAMEPDSDWINFLEILARQAAVAVEDASLFNDMQRSFTELAVAYDAAIEGWARVLQMRHHEPDELYQSLASLTLEMARRLGIAETEMAHIYRGVLLHDIGKLDISDKILFKSGPLTTEEWDVVHHHPAYAYDFLQSIAYLRPAMSIPYCHHEKWDGSGYPRGLHGKDIPLEARIFSVVNVWTVLQQERPFRRAWDRTRATNYIQEQSGKEFDPEVVDAFLHLIAEQP